MPPGDCGMNQSPPAVCQSGCGPPAPPAAPYPPRWVGHPPQGVCAPPLPAQGSHGVPGAHPAPPRLRLCPSPGSCHCPVGAGPPAWGSLLGAPTPTSPRFGCLAAVRGQDGSPQLLQKFEDLIPTVGLTKDMMAVLPKSGECPAGAGWHAQPPCTGTLRGGSGHCRQHAHPSLCFSTDQCTKTIR